MAVELRLADEVALVQRGLDPAADQQADMPKLVCDGAQGCRYEGLPAREEKKPLPMFPSLVPGIDMSQLKKLMEKPDLSRLAAEAAKLMPKAAPSAQQMPDFSKIMQEVAKHIPKPAPNAQQTPVQMPDFSQIAKGLAALAPAAGGKSPQAPPAFQMPDLSKIGKELAKLHIPGVSALQVSASSSDEAEVAHFIPDNKQVCCEGPLEYLKEKLPKLKVSPLEAAYGSAEVVSGSCASAGYNEGPKEDKCFPKMSIHFSKEHAFNMFSEIMTIAKYGKKHGGQAVSAGMKELCA